MSVKGFFNGVWQFISFICWPRWGKKIVTNEEYLIMKITQDLMDELTAQAKASPRLRMNRDLRNSPSDGSQRMLNALEPGTPLPIHRHMKSSETVVCLRGHLREVFYNDAGEVTEVIDLAPNSDCVALNIPLGQWHTVEVLESGTIIMETKDGAYEPLGEDEIWNGDKD